MKKEKNNRWTKPNQNGRVYDKKMLKKTFKKWKDAGYLNGELNHPSKST